MTIVSDEFTHVIGVDTHAAKHAYAILDARIGTVLEERSFPTTPAGLDRALSWIDRRTSPGTDQPTHSDTGPVGGPAGGPAAGRVAVAIEGSGSYGAQLARAAQDRGLNVFEVRPPARGSRARDGKTDKFDAIAAAQQILPRDPARLAVPKAPGVPAAIHIVAAARRRLLKDSNRATQALIALLRTYPLGVDARGGDTRATLPDTTIDQIAAWRTRRHDPVDLAHARSEATRLARRIILVRGELAENEKQSRDLVTTIAPSLLDLLGVGPISAAVFLDAYSYRGRIHSAAAFARMAGAAPLPVQSGNSSHHRLNPGQNRALNNAIDTTVRTLLEHDPETIAYQKRRRTDGTGDMAIRRLLRTIIARKIYRHLNAIMA